MKTLLLIVCAVVMGCGKSDQVWEAEVTAAASAAAFSRGFADRPGSAASAGIKYAADLRKLEEVKAAAVDAGLDAERVGLVAIMGAYDGADRWREFEQRLDDISAGYED